jgi:hypothetical protein
MIYFQKFFKIPGPKDIGMGDSNYAMGTKFFPQEGVPTWEDYYTRIQKEYPIRFFFASTLIMFFIDFYRRFERPLSDLMYWFKSHTYRRYHMLDLRQPCEKGGVANVDCYSYGWRDVPEKMLYAMFNLLGEYLNKECPNDLTQHYSREEINADEGLKLQQDALDEARVINDWWVNGRKAAWAKRDKVQHLWYNAKKSGDVDETVYWELMRKLDDEFEEKTDEMALRLLKIRRVLWS